MPLDNSLNPLPGAQPPLPQQPPPPPPKSKSSGLKIFLILMFVGTVLLGGLAMILVATSFSKIMEQAQLQTAQTGDGFVERVEIAGDASEGKIALITLNGAISGETARESRQGTVADLTRRLRKARRDPAVKAILLQVDSPGGGLTASDMIYAEVLKAKKAGKVIVVWVGNMAASGGYYISAPADSIVCSPTGLVGSFGVIMQRFQVDKLFEDKLGIKVDPIKSTGSKDIGSPFRDMTQEERAYFQRLITKFHQRFVSIIAQGRSELTEAEVRLLANGKLYTAKESLAHKLIDKIGYFDTALAEAKSLAGLSNPQVVVYGTKPNLLQALLSAQSSAPPIRLDRETIRSIISEVQTPRVEARWRGP